jgi:hypothetical protein
MWSEHHDRWNIFAADVLVTAREINQEHRRNMSVEVKNLADVVRQAKEAIGKASTAAYRMNSSAGNLVSTVKQVEGMIGDLDKANAELQAAVGGLSNGGPPLDDVPSSTTSSPPAASPAQAALAATVTAGVAVNAPTPEEGVRSSIAAVQAAP